MTKKYGLIGYPLEHSFSPDYFNTKFKNERIDADEWAGEGVTSSVLRTSSPKGEDSTLGVFCFDGQWSWRVECPCW